MTNERESIIETMREVEDLPPTGTIARFLEKVVDEFLGEVLAPKAVTLRERRLRNSLSEEIRDHAKTAAKLAQTETALEEALEALRALPDDPAAVPSGKIRTRIADLETTMREVETIATLRARLAVTRTESTMFARSATETKRLLGRAEIRASLYLRAIRWAMGLDVGGEPNFDEKKTARGGAPRYWWRTDLMRIAGIDGAGRPIEEVRGEA